MATNSIEATVFFFIALEKACQVQLLADAAVRGTGKSTVKITPEDALAVYRVTGSFVSGWFQGLTEFELLEAREQNSYKPVN